MRYKCKKKKGQTPGVLRKYGLLLAVSGVVLAAPFTAQAKEDEDRTPIEEIVLEVSSSIEVGDVGSEVEVTTDSDECEVSNVDVINEPNSEWKHKDKPRLRVSLDAEYDYYFKSGFNKKRVKVNGSEADVTSVRRINDEEVAVTLTLKALKGTDGDYDLEAEDAEWDLMYGVAEWNGSEDAKSYDLKLYRDGRLVTNVRSVKDTNYHFGSYFNSAGAYIFEVRAVYSSSRRGDWQESDVFEVTAERAAEIKLASAYTITGNGPAGGTWEQDAIGYKYRNADQTYTVNNWQQIGGNWYFFDENSYLKTGWLVWKDQSYYLDENGVMLADTVTPDGRQVGADGILIQ